jgi:uncharacterized membrane protein YfcA
MAIRSSPTDRGGIASPRPPARRRAFFQRYPFLREFLAEQLPLAGGVFALGLGICLLLYGFVPDGERQFPVSGVALTVPQLLWLGLWTGYAMAIVGQASGTFVLAYTASILHFTGVSLSPTCLLIAFLNPFGALLGFRRNHQWNPDMARWLCIGGIVGAPFGPFLRVYFLSDPTPFKAVIGLVLLVTAGQLLLEGWRWFRRREAGEPGLPRGFRILTLARTSRHMRFGYGKDNVTFRHSTMFLTGLGIGVAGATIGIGGGFLLVPILALVYRLPMPVIVAASIPYVIVLSLAGLLSYLFVLPALTNIATPPDWGFGLLVASGAILGAWLAAKTQRFIPEGWLKWSLGAATGLVGVLYVANYFWSLPVRI